MRSCDLSLNDVTRSELVVGEDSYLFTQCVWRQYMVTYFLVLVVGGRDPGFVFVIELRL